MTTSAVEDPPAATSAFLTHLSRIQAQARYALRHVHCEDTRADLAAEVVALAWKCFLRLSARGCRPEEFVSTLALRCSQAVKAGRRLVRSESPKDVMSPVARARRGFTVARIALRGSLPPEVADALLIDPKARVADQAVLRIDYPRWRSGITRRDRAVLDALAAGGSTAEVAARFRISSARISQLRREFLESWEAFHRGER